MKIISKKYKALKAYILTLLGCKSVFKPEAGLDTVVYIGTETTEDKNTTHENEFHVNVESFVEDALDVITEPSDADIELGFFYDQLTYKEKVPFKFLFGKYFELKFECSCCHQTVVLENRAVGEVGYFASNFVKTKDLVDCHYSIRFLEKIGYVFGLSVTEHYGLNYLFLDVGGAARLIYKRCELCDSQIFILYERIMAKYPEPGRSHVSTPDEFLLYKIAHVRFDEDAFFKETKLDRS